MRGSAGWRLVFVCAIAGVALLPRSGRAATETDACIAAAEQSQPLQARGHFRAARDLLLVCARDVCPRVVRRDCKKWLASVDAAQPSIIVRAQDPSGGKLTAVTATLDGQPLPGRLDEPIPVDIGEHVLRIALAGSSREQAFALRRGEQNRVLSFTLEPPATVVAPPVAPPPPVAPAPEKPPPPSSPPPPAEPTATTHSEEPPAEETAPTAPAPTRPIPAVVWALGGGAALAMGTGATLWAVGLGERSGLYSGCGATPAGCTSSQVSSSRTKLIAGDVLFGVGVVAAAAAVWLGIRSRSQAAPPNVGVSYVPRGAMASYTSSF